MATLAERLAGVRREAPAASRPAATDRAELLARWFGARLAILPPATYFDTETTGLSTGAGTIIFLAGLARAEGDTLVVRQHLLPDYPHERPLLRLVTAALAAAPRLVTYNGRSFDVPLLAARLTVNGLFAEQAALPTVHDDLLPIARRLWRRPLGGARLATIEAGVLGVRRTEDCPGSEVPARYFSFLRGGTPDLLAVVLDHNLQDVVSLALLEAELCRLREGGWRDAGILDARGMALDLLRAGAIDDALELVDASIAAADAEDATALRRLATRLLLARGEVERAEELWQL